MLMICSRSCHSNLVGVCRSRWRTGKERFEQLSACLEALRASLEGNAKQLSVLPESSQEMANGQDR